MSLNEKGLFENLVTVEPIIYFQRAKWLIIYYKDGEVFKKEIVRENPWMDKTEKEIIEWAEERFGRDRWYRVHIPQMAGGEYFPFRSTTIARNMRKEDNL